MSNDLTGRSISPLPSTSLPLKKKQKLDQTKAFKINSRFNASDFDITIVSSDEVQFKLHKANLIGGSEVFADMLSTGSNIASCESSVVSSIPTLHLTETSSILERIFKYIYPTIIDTVNDEQWNEDWLELGLYRQDIKEEITAIDKYKIVRGIENFYCLHLLRVKYMHYESPRSIDAWSLAECFKFGDHFGFSILTEAVVRCFVTHATMDLNTFLELILNKDFDAEEEEQKLNLFTVSREGLTKLVLYISGVDAWLQRNRKKALSRFYSPSRDIPFRCICGGSWKSTAPIGALIEARSALMIDQLKSASDNWICLSCKEDWRVTLTELSARVDQTRIMVDYWSVLSLIIY